MGGGLGCAGGCSAKQAAWDGSLSKDLVQGKGWTKQVEKAQPQQKFQGRSVPVHLRPSKEASVPGLEEPGETWGHVIPGLANQGENLSLN